MRYISSKLYDANSFKIEHRREVALRARSQPASRHAQPQASNQETQHACVYVYSMYCTYSCRYVIRVHCDRTACASFGIAYWTSLAFHWLVYEYTWTGSPLADGSPWYSAVSRDYWNSSIVMDLRIIQLEGNGRCSVINRFGLLIKLQRFTNIQRKGGVRSQNGYFGFCEFCVNRSWTIQIIISCE